MSRPASIISSVVVALSALFLGYLYGGKYAGWAKAQIDTRRGAYQVVVIGLGGPWDKELDRVYAEKYHVKRNRIAYCIVSPWAEGYSEGYNSVSHPAIEKMYFNRFYDDALSEAIREYVRTHNLDEERKRRYEEIIREIESR